MRRKLIAVAILLLALATGCGAGAWVVARPPVEPYVVAGASDVQVREIGRGERLLTYDAPGDHFAWYFAVADRLEHSGWVPPDKWGPREQFNTYRRVSPIWGGYAGYIWERVELRGEASHARIVLRRWYTFPWRQYLDYFR